MRASFPPRSEAGLRGGARGRKVSRAERLLHALGADPHFVDAVLGDLAEERATRRGRDGARAANWWYVREALRSAPHLVASAIRGASWRRRTVLVTCVAAIAFVVTFAVTSLFRGADVPARLVISGGLGDEVIVNNVQPVRLRMQVLDSSGHVLPDTGVRFRWISGAPIPVSTHGIATCTQSGDAAVRASLGPLTTTLILRCRPVSKVRTLRMVNLVVGDPAMALPFLAVDERGNPVSLLRGEISVEDSSVATLDVAADGTRLVRGRAPGNTILDIRIGNRGAGTGVHVYERASSPEGIRPGQHLAVPVELAGGEMRQWHLAAAPQTYYVAMLPDGDEEHVPRLAIIGANCMPGLDEHSFFCVAQHDASLFVFHSREGDQTRVVRGRLAIWRQSWR